MIALLVISQTPMSHRSTSRRIKGENVVDQDVLTRMPPARLAQQHQLILANRSAYFTMQSMELRSISTYAVLVHGAFELPTVETPLYAFSHQKLTTDIPASACSIS